MTKSKRQNRKPQINGALVFVPISNRDDSYAILDRVDFYHLQKRSIDVTSLPWLLNNNGGGTEYVRVNLPDIGITQLSRLIMGEPPHSRVSHKNNNRLDFRRDNLVLADGSNGRMFHKPRLPDQPQDAPA